MKLKTKLALAALTTLSLTLAACDRGAQDVGIKPTEAQLSQLYIKDFDATKEFISLFVSNDIESFNNSLPAVRRYDFNPVLNSLAQHSNAVQYLESDPEASKSNATYKYLIAEATLKVNNDFNNVVKDIEANPEQAVVDDQYQFDIKQAYLPVFLKQLAAACVSSNNYQNSVEEIASQLISKDEKGEIAPFPEDLRIFLGEWNLNLKASCDTSKAISDFLEENDYSFKRIQEILLESQTQLQQQIAEKKAEGAKVREEELNKIATEKAAEQEESSAGDNSASNDSQEDNTQGANSAPEANDDAPNSDSNPQPNSK